ncbi:MAG: LCP family protein [Eubacteriales bacterium]|nr:LCP family protein [Eubacteriales bacterium]
MRQEHYDAGRSRRAKRSSGHAYAEIMRGRQEGETDFEEDFRDGYVEDEFDTQWDDGERNDRSVRARKTHKKAVGRGRKRKPVLLILLGVLLVIGVYFVGKNLLQGENWTVAVFGVDSREGSLEKNTRSDVIMLVNINKKTHEVKLASVYRDTYLRVNDDSEYNKINKAYEEGGHAQAVAALEENLDIKIDDYMTFSWAAVAKGINELGGVDLEISDAEFSIINAFITETVNSTGIGSVQLTHAGMQHLDGVQAVAYGRLRLIDTDFNRTARQRKVLSLALDKAKQADPGKLVNLAAALLPEVSTSIGIDDIAPMLKNIGDYQLTETKGFPFSLKTMDIGKLDCVVPTTLASNVELLHQFLFGETEYKASARVQEISDRIARDSGLTEAGTVLSDFGTDGGVIYHTPEPETAAPQETEPQSSQEESLSGEAEETETGTDESTETENGSDASEGDGEVPEESTEQDEMQSEDSQENGSHTDRPENGQRPGETQNHSGENAGEGAAGGETGPHGNGPSVTETPQIGEVPGGNVPEDSGNTSNTQNTEGPGSHNDPGTAADTNNTAGPGAAEPGAESETEAAGPGV